MSAGNAPPAAANTLGYATAGLPPAPAMPRWLRIALLFIVLPLAPTPFLHFAFDISPLDIIRAIAIEGLHSRGFLDLQTFGELATPFFLGPLLFAWHARLAWRAPATFWERIAAWLIGATSLAITGLFTGNILWQGGTGPDLWRTLTGIAAAVFGLMVLAVLWWRLHHADAAASLLLYTAYIANACLCLLYFHDQVGMGWWLTLLSTGTLLSAMGLHLLWAVLAVSSARPR